MCSALPCELYAIVTSYAAPELPEDFPFISCRLEKGSLVFIQRFCGNVKHFTKETTPNGVQITRQNGLIHSLKNQPAVEYPTGRKEWWSAGERHRGNNDPAVVWMNKNETVWIKEWWYMGFLTESRCSHMTATEKLFYAFTSTRQNG